MGGAHLQALGLLGSLADCLGIRVAVRPEARRPMATIFCFPVLWSLPCRRQVPDGSACDKGQALADSTRASARRAGVRRSLDLASGLVEGREIWAAAAAHTERGYALPRGPTLTGRGRRHRLVRRRNRVASTRRPATLARHPLSGPGSHQAPPSRDKSRGSSTPSDWSSSAIQWCFISRSASAPGPKDVCWPRRPWSARHAALAECRNAAYRARRRCARRSR